MAGSRRVFLVYKIFMVSLVRNRIRLNPADFLPVNDKYQVSTSIQNESFRTRRASRKARDQLYIQSFTF